jgi:hypothetical protein
MYLALVAFVVFFPDRPPDMPLTLVAVGSTWTKHASKVQEARQRGNAIATEKAQDELSKKLEDMEGKKEA